MKIRNYAGLHIGLWLPLFILPAVVFADVPVTKIIFVAKKGNDANPGTSAAPLLTIGKAVTLAHPGDRVVVRKGIYREQIVIATGGRSAHSRITYTAAPGEAVIIKGSEKIIGWRRDSGQVWRTVLNNNLFEKGNPYTTLVNKDSSYRHLGEVYLDDHPLREAPDLREVSVKGGTWSTYQEDGKTVIVANFGRFDPNTRLTEINVRSGAFIAAHSGVNYIVLNGFRIAHIASPLARMSGEQSGAISVSGGTHWVIRNCRLEDCKSVAISIGQAGHPYPNANAGRPAFSDLKNQIDSVGHHQIQHNVFRRCGQAAIFGLLQGTGSIIRENLIEDINSDGGYPANDAAGIHLSVAVDALIAHNLIRRIGGNRDGYGIFLEALIQGTRLTQNIIAETKSSCIYVYNSHGPVLVDNNIFSGPGTASGEGIRMISAEANVFVQNIFFDCAFVNKKVPGRSFATINYLPHSLIIKQTIPALPIDNRWFGNLFIRGGLDQLNDSRNCVADYNVFIEGAASSTWEKGHSRVEAVAGRFSLLHSIKRADLSLDYSALPVMSIPELSPHFLGFFALSGQYIENAAGTPVVIDRDFSGKTKTGTQMLPGAFYQPPRVDNRPSVLFNF